MEPVPISAFCFYLKIVWTVDLNSVCQPHISMIELLSPQQSCIGFVRAVGINPNSDRKGSNAAAEHVVPKT